MPDDLHPGRLERVDQRAQRHPGIEIRLDASDRVIDIQVEDMDVYGGSSSRGRVEPATGRLVFSFADPAVQAAIRGQGVALVRSPFLQDCVASGDLVMPFPQLRMAAGYRHVLVVNPAGVHRPHVEAFLGWLAEEFQHAPQLED